MRAKKTPSSGDALHGESPTPGPHRYGPSDATVASTAADEFRLEGGRRLSVFYTPIHGSSSTRMPIAMRRYALHMSRARRAEFETALSLVQFALRAIGEKPDSLRRNCPLCGRDSHGLYVARDSWISVSHAGGLVAVAVSRDGPVGIDIESEANAEAAEKVAKWAGLCGADGHLRLWTATEAVAKATEVGLLDGLTGIELQRSGADLVAIAADGRMFMLAMLQELPSGYIGTLAIDATRPHTPYLEHWVETDDLRSAGFIAPH